MRCGEPQGMQQLMGERGRQLELGRDRRRRRGALAFALFISVVLGFTIRRRCFQCGECGACRGPRGGALLQAIEQLLDGLASEFDKYKHLPFPFKANSSSPFS